MRIVFSATATLSPKKTTTATLFVRVRTAAPDGDGRPGTSDRWTGSTWERYQYEYEQTKTEAGNEIL
jgi:hypothetical protein